MTRSRSRFGEKRFYCYYFYFPPFLFLLLYFPHKTAFVYFAPKPVSVNARKPRVLTNGKFRALPRSQTRPKVFAPSPSRPYTTNPRRFTEGGQGSVDGDTNSAGTKGEFHFSSFPDPPTMGHRNSSSLILVGHSRFRFSSRFLSTGKASSPQRFTLFFYSVFNEPHCFLESRIIIRARSSG